MEYIKKEELIEGEIYTHEKGNIFRCDQINNTIICGKYINITQNVFRKPPENPGNFWIKEIRLATSEEKHWLESCITADKFITFKEAMKTFITEYVECILQQESSDYKLGIIYKTRSYGYIGDGYAHYSCNLERFKPSTKEAYDAQFVVKESEFVLPEKWVIKFNYEWGVLKQFKPFDKSFNGNASKTSFYGYNSTTEQVSCDTIIKPRYTEITLNQFKKYVLKEETIVEEVKVIKPLPQFKVIETIETITKVENNEGNQFFIGDKITIISGDLPHTIKGFKYYGGNMVVITDNTELDINDIEHYIEPKIEVEPEFILSEKWCIKNIDDKIGEFFNSKIGVTCYTGESHKNRYLHSFDNRGNDILKTKPYANVSSFQIRDTFTEITLDQFKKYVLKEEVKEETLLEKAKRLYPIGTKVKTATNNHYIITIKDQSNFEIDLNNNITATENYIIYLFDSYKNKWAEIVE